MASVSESTISGSTEAEDTGSTSNLSVSPEEFKIAVIKISRGPSAYQGSLVCNIRLDAQTERIPMGDGEQELTRAFAYPLTLTKTSILSLHLLKRWMYIPVGSIQVKSINHSDVCLHLSSNAKPLDKIQHITLHLTVQESNKSESDFTAQAAGIQFSAVKVTLNHGQIGKHTLRAISGGNRVINMAFGPEEEPSELPSGFALQPHCSLNTVVQQHQYRWFKGRPLREEFRYSKLLAQIEVEATQKSLAKIEVETTQEWLKVADHPTIELRLSPEQLLISLENAMQLLEKKSKLQRRLRKSTDVMKYIVKLGKPVAGLNSVAEAVVEVVEGVVNKVGDLVKRDEDVMSLLEQFSKAVKYLHTFEPGSLKNLEDSLRRLEDMGRGVQQLVGSYISHSNPFSQATEYDRLMHLKSRLTEFMGEFKNSRRAQTAKWKTFLQELLILHYIAFLERQVWSTPQVPARGRRECTPKTRVGTMEDIKTWINNVDLPQNILWLTGYPGTGKSTVALTIVRTWCPKDVVSSFFFSRTSPGSNARNLWITIMLALCKLDILFAKALYESLSRHGLDPNAYTAAGYFRRLIAEPLKTLEKTTSVVKRPVVVVVDALDECAGLDGNNDYDQTLLSVKMWTELPKRFKLVITSRDSIVIREILAPPSATDIPQFIELTLDTKKSDPDIRCFLEAECEKIRQKFNLGDVWPGRKAVDTMVTRARGHFIYAATLTWLLWEGPEATLQLVMDDKLGEHGKIASLYNRILGSSFPSDGEQLGLVLDLKGIVGAIALTEDPTKRVTVILGILGIPGSSLQSISDKLHSVLDGKDLSFRHRSFVEHLVSDQCLPKFRVDMQSQRQELAIKYMEALQQCLRFNMGNLKYPFDLTGNPEMSLIETQPVTVHASLHWGQHLEHVSWTVIATRMKKFLAESFIYWLEVLSLVGKPEAARKNIRWLEACVQRSESGSDEWVTSFLNDVKRFMYTFREPLSRSAGHIYFSALALAPRALAPGDSPATRGSEFIIRYGDHTKKFPWRISLTQEGAVTEPELFAPDKADKDPFAPNKTPLHVSLSTSHSGSLAITSARSIHLRDPSTGKNLLAIPLHYDTGGPVSCVSYSPDGKTLVAGATDGVVRLWNTTNRTRLGEFVSHRKGVTSVLFLDNGNAVVAGAKDGVVYLWRLSGPTKKPITFQPHKDGEEVLGIAGVSSDSFASISSSEITTLRWNGSKIEVDRSIQVPLDYGELSAIACFQNGPWIAAGSVDGGMHIWDRKTGEELTISPFTKHSGPVTCIAIHGDYVASGSEDHTIIVWDRTKGEVIAGPLHGHSGAVTCVVFSVDGKHLFSGSKDGTVRMWDVLPSTMAARPNSEAPINLDDCTIDEDGCIRSRADGQILWLPEVMDAHGWIRGPGKMLWAWIPLADRKRLCWGRCRAIIDGKEWTRLRFRLLEVDPRG